ncbi:hypothetical protein [Romboutsia ilealis]|uniref:hypothetical protein n=1 Tax=Romboutsia ilealis TaxID=1115758 RepID=UPI002F3E9099
MEMIYDEEYWEMLEGFVATHEIVIDRPKGTIHLRYSNMLYKIDYGYIKNTISMDNEGIDIWIGTEGSNRVSGLICTIDRIKVDVEIKVLYNCLPEEMDYIYHFHNSSNYMKGILFERFSR